MFIFNKNDLHLPKQHFRSNRNEQSAEQIYKLRYETASKLWPPSDGTDSEPEENDVDGNFCYFIKFIFQINIISYKSFN